MNKSVTNLIKGARPVRTPGMLSADAERDLVCAWQERGDRRARDRLVAAFAPLAASITKRFMRGTGEADPDLLQQANIGLMKAADRFDPERGIRFSSYAVWWVRAEVQAYARANMSIVRRPNSGKTRAAAARIASLDAEAGPDPAMDQADRDARLADALGLDADSAAALRAQVTGTDQSLNVPANGEDGLDRIALLVDPSSLEDPAGLQLLERAGLRRILADALSSLPERERDIVVATQVADPPATLEELGVQHGISKERVRQLRERGYERLRVALAKRGLGAGYFA